MTLSVLSICPFVDAFSMILLCLLLFGVSFTVCPCAILVYVSLQLFISVSSIYPYHCFIHYIRRVIHFFLYFLQRILCIPSKLVPLVLFSCDGCCFDVFTVSGYDVSCFCDSYYVGSIVMVMVTSPNAMGPWSTILLLNHYSRPY